MTTSPWANIGDDAGAIHALLQRIADHVSVPLIQDLWIFPARRIAAGESIVIVVGANGEDDDRRRVITAHFTVIRNKKGAATVTARFDEHGTAPTAAVPRIVQGVLRRLGEDMDASPREEIIGASHERWDALIVDLGGRPTSGGEDPATDAALSPLSDDTRPIADDVATPDAAPAHPQPVAPAAHETAARTHSD